MSAAELYQPRTIKRQRATRDEADQRRARLVALTEEKRPATVRQIFYAATVEGLVEKTEAGYAKVKTDLVLLRRSGAMPYHWLADNTRWQHKPETFKGLADALRETALFYRKALWVRTPIPTSRCGLKRTHSRVRSTRSPPSSTSH